MTPNRLISITFRCLISALLAFCFFSPNAKAQDAATAINGVYNGTYTCAAGPRTVKLSLLASGSGSLTGLFTFYLPPNSHSQAYTYSISGTFDGKSGKFKLSPVKWEVQPPLAYSMVGMDGAFDPNAGQVTGKIASPFCGAFQATRDLAESANIDSVMAGLRTPGTNPRISAQPPQPPAPQYASNQSAACGLISQADAESVVGYPLRAMPPLDQSKCNFLGSRRGLMSGIRIQVIVEVRYSATPNPGAVNQRRQLFNDSVRAGVLKDIPNVADYALWDWTNDYDGTGRLVAYKGGTTELFITIEGMPENTALPGAEKLAARVLGPKTGFVYTAAASPEKTCTTADFHNISGCLTAKQALESLGIIEDSQQKAELGGPAMVELVKARAEFWTTSPNSDRYPLAVGRLRRALSAVDFTYLFTHYYSLNFGVPPDGHGQQRQNFYQALLGTPPEEDVIHESARKQFDAWISAVYNRLNGGLGDILNIRSRLPQALDETEVIYERYRTARDTAELQAPAAAAEHRKRREEMQAEEAVQEEARAGASVRQNVCISDDLTTEWRNPPAGGKMESLKRLLIQSLRERARAPGYDQTRWIAVDSRYYSAWNPDTSFGKLVSTIPGGSCGTGHREILALAP
jgi:hypothetical protein